MAFGDALENMVMKHWFNIAAQVTRVLYVGLSSQDPLDDASGTSEPPGKGYARVKTMNGSGTSWQVANATGVTVDNSAVITFAAASADWGTMTHVAIFSGSTAGASVLVHGQLTASKTVANGDTARFSAGAFDICLK